jgi:hypothetical protein
LQGFLSSVRLTKTTNFPIHTFRGFSSQHTERITTVHNYKKCRRSLTCFILKILNIIQ